MTNFNMKSSVVRVDFRRLKCKSSSLRDAFLLIPLYLSLLGACNSCMVTTPSGTFEGAVKRSILASNYKFCGYLGIPYAKAPVDGLRFRNPIPIEPLSEVYDATSDRNMCSQTDPVDQRVEGDENCLHLNVYVPPKVSGKHPISLLPVIVFIHGGVFYFGSGSYREYSPDYLMPHNVIFVTVNYRLNVFGFLNLGIPECAGNMGLRDQVLALKWVQKNIQSFGGDPNSVTLMGQSAGAMSAYLLALSPLARGLFHKVILMSAYIPNWVSRDVETYSIRFAQFVGYEGDINNRQEILEYLQNLDPRYLTYSVDTAFSQELNWTDIRYDARHRPFFPSADDYLGYNALLPSSLEELGKQTSDIPILMGQTSADGANFFYPTYKNNEEFIAFIKKYVILFLDPIYIGNERVETEVVDKVREYYFGRYSDENELNRAVQDTNYFNFYQKTTIFEASYRNNKIYQYQFSYDGSFQFYKRLYLGEEYYRNVSGASHGEDLNYLFYSDRYFPVLTFTDDDYKIIQRMTTWWTNFAKTGNPNSDYNYAVEGWGPITTQRYNYLRIDKDSYFIEGRINEERWQFWDCLPRVVQFPYRYPIESFSYINQYN